MFSVLSSRHDDVGLFVNSKTTCDGTKYVVYKELMGISGNWRHAIPGNGGNRGIEIMCLTEQTWRVTSSRFSCPWITRKRMEHDLQHERDQSVRTCLNQGSGLNRIKLKG